MTFINFEEVREMINGVGRLVQYQFNHPSTFVRGENGRFDIEFDYTTYTKDILWVYNGQFKNGKCEGFGISVQVFNSDCDMHIGYFRNGYKCGYGMRLKIQKD